MECKEVGRWRQTTKRVPSFWVVGFEGSDPARRALAAAGRILRGREGWIEVVTVEPTEGLPLASDGRGSPVCGANSVGLARGKTRRPREKVEAEITSIVSKPWVRRAVRWDLTGDQPKD